MNGVSRSWHHLFALRFRRSWRAPVQSFGEYLDGPEAGEGVAGGEAPIDALVYVADWTDIPKLRAALLEHPAIHEVIDADSDGTRQGWGLRIAVYGHRAGTEATADGRPS